MQKKNLRSLLRKLLIKYETHVEVAMAIGMEACIIIGVISSKEILFLSGLLLCPAALIYNEIITTLEKKNNN